MIKPTKQSKNGDKINKERKSSHTRKVTRRTECEFLNFFNTKKKK